MVDDNINDQSGDRSLELFITELRAAEPFLDQLPIPYLILDEKLKIMFCTLEAASILRLSVNTLNPSNPKEAFSKYLDSSLGRFIEWITDEHASHGFEIRLHTSGESFFIAFRRMQKFGKRKLYHLKCVPSEQFLLLNSEVNVYKTVFNHVDKAVLITDQGGCIQSINPRFTELLGYEWRDVMGRQCDFLFDDDDNTIRDEIETKLIEQDRWQGRVGLVAQDRETIMFSLSVILPASGFERLSRVYIAENIKNQIDIENKLRKQAETDSLTKLHNRLAFNRYFYDLFTEVQRTGNQLSLMFIDLDNFKRLNDSYGHDKGDLLLKILSDRLLNCVRSGDFVARLGGDEFIIILSGETENRFLSAITDKVLAVINAPFQLDNLSYQSSGSIGVATYPQDALDAEQLLRAADTAMYIAKKSGRNRVHFFDQHANQEENSGPEIRHQVAESLIDGSMKAYYQPVHSLESGKVIGFEALARLVLRDDDVRLPGYFMPHIKGDSLMVQLGMHMASLVFSMADILYEREVDTYLTINMSADQLRSAKLIEHFELLSRNHSDAKTLIKIEITEVVLFEDDEGVSRHIKTLIELGFDIVLDDFGTGYASVIALKKFDFSAIKIDKDFIKDISDKKNVSLLKGMISLLHSLDLEIVCEGIEQASQLKFLREQGCDLGQGFYYAKAFPKKELLAYYSQHG